MFAELNKNKFTISIINKYFLKLISMHVYCLVFPIVFLALTINISFYVFNYELWEIKNLIINSIILITFVIPFAFLPFSLFNLTRKPIFSILKLDKSKYFKLVITIVSIFLVYYFFIFAYMLMLSVLFSINIDDTNISLINFVFRPLTQFNGTYFNNGINWLSLLFTLATSFLCLFFLGYLITIIFHKKLTLILTLLIFLLSMFFGGMLFPISVLSFNDTSYQWLPFLSLYLYPIIMIHVGWIGYDIFTFNNILGQATEYIITARILIISSSIVYGVIGLSICFYIMRFIFLYKNSHFFHWLYKKNIIWKKFQTILNDNFRNEVFLVTNKKCRKKIIKIAKKSTKYSKENISFIDTIDSFIPELTFIENLEFLNKIYNFKYDFSQLNEIIEFLNLQFIINKKMQKCKQDELYYLNIVFSLMQKPQRICLINPSLFFSKFMIAKILNMINVYANDNGIKIILISENIKELQIFAKDIYIVNEKGISSMS